MNNYIQYYAYEPVARLYEHTDDPVKVMNSSTFRPKTLAGKIVQWTLQYGRWEHLTDDLPTKELIPAYNTMSVRVHNMMLTFTEQLRSLNDLTMFDFNTAVLTEGVRRSRSIIPCFETGWSIRTKTEDCFIELCTHLIPVYWPIPMLQRVKNRITKRGPVSDSIPRLQYTLILKVFNSPASCYVIHLNGIDVVVPFSEMLLKKTNIDFYPPITITPEAKERYEQRFPYFRDPGRNSTAS